MANRRRSGRKVRVDFKQNRGDVQRTDDWTRRYHSDHENLVDESRSESVRAKGALSRKRTVIVGADDAPLIDPKLWRPGLITSIQGPVCQVRATDGSAVDCTVRRVLKTQLIAQRSAITVGDRVWYAIVADSLDDCRTGVIESIEPRRSLLARGARVGHDARREGHRKQHLIAANVDQLVIISSAARPRFKPHLIDRFLVAAAAGDVRPIVCFNKCDLTELVEAESSSTSASETADTSATDRQTQANDSDDDEYEEIYEEVESDAAYSLDELVDEYRGLGYTVILTSATRGDGIELLRSELRDRVSVFSGQSGVGKSSLLNALQPGLKLTVADVSEDNEKGRHTTTHARLLPLDCGGYVVDTPGIRAFDLWDIAPGQLEACFAEFPALISGCRFKDCHHCDEVGCAILAAVERGEVSARRYWSYRKMLAEVSRK